MLESFLADLKASLTASPIVKYARLILNPRCLSSLADSAAELHIN